MDELTKEEQAIKDFLLDIQCLEALEGMDTFNLFDVLKISRMEIRHSNVMSWLLDPNENHSLGNRILSALNSFLAKAFYKSDIETSLKLLTMDYDDILVYREWQNIDILIQSTERKFVLCIENKLGSQEHDNQLNRYYEIIEEKYGEEYTKIYLYLTPDGRPPKNDENDVWRSIKYEEIISILERETGKLSLEPRRKEFIQSYIDILKRETMENTKITEICQEIYRKHKIALDLIFENRPDKLQNLFEIFKKWCQDKHNKKEIVFVENKSTKSYCRFRTQSLDKIIPDSSSISGWGTLNHYFYEICTYTEKDGTIRYYIQLSFSSLNLTEEERMRLENINRLFSDKKMKKDWQWRTVYKTKTFVIKESDIFLDESKITKELDSGFALLLKNESLITKFANS